MESSEITDESPVFLVDPKRDVVDSFISWS